MDLKMLQKQFDEIYIVHSRRRPCCVLMEYFKVYLFSFLLFPIRAHSPKSIFLRIVIEFFQTKGAFHCLNAAGQKKNTVFGKLF